LVGVTLFALVVRLGGITQNTPRHLTLANIIDSIRLEKICCFFGCMHLAMTIFTKNDQG
jgi:hypothetical protein